MRAREGEQAMKTRARDNPFASDRVERLLVFESEWINLNWSQVMKRLEDMDYRAAVVGPHGSGKTTLLRKLKTNLAQQGFEVESIFLNEQKKSLDESVWQRLAQVGLDTNKRVMVMLDGAEQLSWREWRRFYSAAQRHDGLVITQHSTGKLPVLLRTETRLDMFADFARRLAPDVDFEDAVLKRIFTSTQGNVREALWQCYDLLAEGSVGVAG